MCFDWLFGDKGTGAADLDIKVKTTPAGNPENLTPEQIEQNDAAEAEKRANEYNLPAYGDGSGDPPGKPGSVNLMDPDLSLARKHAKMRAALGYGRANTFLTGPEGDTSPMKLSKPTLLGGG